MSTLTTSTISISAFLEIAKRQARDLAHDATNEIEPQFRAIRALITDIIARCLNADMDYDDWNEFLGGLERDFYTARDEAFRRLITITKKWE